jgi:UDP-N-acetyl-D-galactosamine dehydrogenase
VAEAAKVIENSQRDINIAFVNELAKIFNLMNIDTQAVLEAAGTKWNFLPFKPGLVGGHCIRSHYFSAKSARIWLSS